ncbi:MAG: hypothetical protein ACOYNC_18455 [Bacteroidales bacterium]
MITYLQVFNKIKSALTGRMVGTKVQVEDHEAAELMLLDYVQQIASVPSGSNVREAHAAASAGVNCNLVWSTVFANTNYAYAVNGFDSLGNPVEIYLISKSTSKIVIKTLVGATMTALAMPYGTEP